MNKNINIAMLIPSLKGGGAERVFVNLANFLADNGFVVTLVTTNKGDYFSSISGKVKLLTFSLPITTSRLGALRRMSSFIYRSRKLINQVKPDILFCTMDMANIAGSIIRKLSQYHFKLVLREATVILDTNTSKTLKVLLRKAFNSADLVIANSPDTAGSVRSLIKEHRNIPIEVIGNPVYKDSFNGLIENRGTTHERKYILSVGSLNVKKDFPTLIKAFKKIAPLHDVDLLILGEGPQESYLKSLTLELGLAQRVFFKGFVEEPYQYYKDAELFVLCSLYEGFGNVLVESLSFGTPVICTRCNGGPDFILNGGEYGDLVPVGDVDQVAGAILHRLENLDQLDRTRLILRAQSFSLEAIGATYAELLRNLIKKPNR